MLLNCLKIFILSIALLFSRTSTAIAGAAPITGTFIIPDLTYKSEAEYREFFQELKNTGINTVIFMLTSNLNISCEPTQYTEENDIWLNTGNPPYLPIAVKLAKQMNMDMYFDLAGYPLSSCFDFADGSVANQSTNKGALIAFSLRSIDKLKTFIVQQGLSWNDPLIKGFYLVPEGDTRRMESTDSPQFLFFKDISQLIKQKEPTKKILISPGQWEEADYWISKRAFTNIFADTNVDIISPQDSMGVGVTKTFTASAEHFRALRDAAVNYPGKEGWANIETFTGNGPGPFDRIVNQIAAAKPYVPKMITWIYQQSMLSNPLSDNIAAINPYAPYYTPQNAELRRKLRTDYMNYYGISSTPSPSPAASPTPLYYCNKTSYSCVKTSASYQSALDPACAQNLGTYLPNQTTGICYNTATSCESACQNPTKPGDFDKSGKVDLLDYNLLTSNFGNPYTLLDYNLIATNFGK